MTYYDEIAEGYEELHKEEQEKKIAVVKQELNANTSINKNTCLLDVGCGTGITSNFPCRVVGIDPSEKLLKKFSAPLAIKAEAVLAAAEDIPFADETFDVVVSITALQNFDDVEQGIKEMHRVGKPQAQYALSFLKKSEKKDMIKKSIGKYFNVKKEIEEDKDIILFCSKKLV